MKKKPCKRTLIFTGGGTGGHIYPGLAVADELRIKNSDVRIVWIGSSRRDKVMVCAGKGENAVASVDAFIAIPAGKLRRYFSFRTLWDAFKVAAGFFVSFFYLIRIKPVALFSKGGFVSVMPCAAAKLLGIPVYTHECDVSPGLANRLNARFARRLLLSYEQSRAFFPKASPNAVSVTGNPVRPVFYTADKAKGAAFLGLTGKISKPVLLILGGSSGAHQINELVLQNLEWLCSRFIVVHQTGQGEDFKKACAAARTVNKNAIAGAKDELEFAESGQTAGSGRAAKSGSGAEVHPALYLCYDFIYADMPHVLALSDIVLSRAGANSLWECAVCAKPMVLLPLAGSGTRGDQIENAELFEKQNAAFVLNPREKDGKKLSGSLCSTLEKLQDVSLRRAMGNAAFELTGKQKAAQKIADILYTEVLQNDDV